MLNEGLVSTLLKKIVETHPKTKALIEQYRDAYFNPFELDCVVEGLRQLNIHDSDFYALCEAYEDHVLQENKIKEDQVKVIVERMKKRVYHPKGEFTKTGPLRYFTLYDQDLVPTDMTPSEKNRFVQMKYGRTQEYVNKVIKKYKPQNTEDLKMVLLSIK